MDLSVVSPVYHGEKMLEELVARIHAAVSPHLTSAMHHPKTLIGQELLHQTIVNYKKFFSNKNYQSITF